MKKMATLVLVLLLLLSMAVPAMAANTNSHTITITNTNLPDGHEYQAYQVFKGDLVEKDGKKILTNIEWGTGVDSTNLLAALKADETIGSEFIDCTTAIDVADAMKTFKDNSAEAKAFADVVSKCLTTTAAGTSKAVSDHYEIEVTGDGYYFIKDTTESLSETEADAVTRYMLQVVGNVTVAVKADVPSIEKKIVKDDGKLDDYNERSVGESEKYQITSRIPDMSAFDTYTFVMTDTFSKGLTYNEDIKIVIDEKNAEDTVLMKDRHYTVTADTAENGETTLTITFTNLKQWQDKNGQNIVVTYSATINENAVLGTAGNANKVKLEYSNDPNHSGSGEGHVTGETPEDTVYTYVTGIKLTKTDENGNTLTGAKFKIEGLSRQIVIINKEIYRESESGTYYRLKDGTYTTTAPTETTKSQYDDNGEKKYEKVTVVNKETVQNPVVAEGWVDENGVISFEGLGEGTYTITELIAPEGYNLLKDPIYIKIEWTEPTDTSANCTWTAKQVDKTGNALKNGDDDITLTLENGVFTIKVENKAGNTLPSTGGIGTTVFYAVGGLLLVGAVIVMITRKRMSAEK